MLQKIAIKNYRNIKDFEFIINKKGSIFFAPNGSGKTNFLESIYFCVVGSSFRQVPNRGELVLFNEKFLRINLEWNEESIESILSIDNSKISRKILLNKKKVSPAKLLEDFPVILFAPHSVDLISGEPSTRREDMDIFLSMCSQDYGRHLLRYNNVLRNRNVVIKNISEKKSSLSELEFWTNELVKSAAVIFKERTEFFENFNEFIKTHLHKESLLRDSLKSEDIKVMFTPNINSSVEDFSVVLAAKFKENMQKELFAGKTLYGVHKDDFYISVENKNLRFFGSRGQQRIGTFLLKISQIFYYFSLRNRYPLFIIDDIMSELDKGNRERIATYLSEVEFQYILTSAEKSEIPKKLLLECSIITL